MKIKSLEDLKKIREEAANLVRLREQGEALGEQKEVLIGMATCGISSGARETLNAFVEEIAKENLENIKIIPVGCIGYCHSEPTVQINIPGKKPVLYGNVKANKVKDIIESHIKKGEVVQDLVIQKDFEKA